MLTTAYCLLQDISYYSLNLCAFEWDYTYKRVLIVRNFETRLSVAYLVEGSIGEVCCGQGEVLRNLSRMPVPEVESFLPLRLTVSSPALVQLKRSDPVSLAAESTATVPSGDLPLSRQPLR